MSRISREAWAVCGLGLLVLLIAEVLRATGMHLVSWGALWVAGWIGILVGLGMAVSHRNGWIAAGVSITFTILGLYFAATGANGSFMAMSSIAVLALATVAGMVVLVGLDQEVDMRSLKPPAYSVILGLAGVGVILLAGAFALLASGLPLGYLAFGFAAGLVGSALSFGALSIGRKPEEIHRP